MTHPASSYLRRLFQIAFLLSLCALLSMAASAEYLQATLPSFSVTINGEVLDNTKREYPFLVCQDITYVPMTYYDCRAMGLTSQWTAADGLHIDQSAQTPAPLTNYTRTTPTETSARVQVATGAIYVNGKAIDNASEPYPLLLYRDITYFPLTWHFGVEEFGWTMSFDSAQGLQIQSTPYQVRYAQLEDMFSVYEGSIQSDILTDGKYLYFQGQDGTLYGCPLADIQAKQALLEVSTERGPLRLYDQAGHFYARGHVGGATMGHNVFYRLNGLQTPEEVYSASSGHFVDLGSCQVTMQVGPMASEPYKLTLTDASGTRIIGQDDYAYRGGAGTGMYNLTDCALYDGKIYCVGFHLDSSEHSHLLRVDPTTGATESLGDDPVDAFSLQNGIAYYLSGSENTLYALDVKTGKRASVGTALSYAACERGVYYQDKDTSRLCYYDSSTGASSVLESDCTALSAQNGYVGAIFANGCAVYAASEPTTPQFTRSDAVDLLRVAPDGSVVFRLSGGNTVGIVTK